MYIHIYTYTYDIYTYIKVKIFIFLKKLLKNNWEKNNVFIQYFLIRIFIEVVVDDFCQSGQIIAGGGRSANHLTTS